VTASARAESIVTTVSDNGPGITIEPIEAIFDTFASSKAEGMGLGLAISRTIIESYGGKIWAENRADGGASVHFELPRVERASSSRQAQRGSLNIEPPGMETAGAGTLGPEATPQREPPLPKLQFHDRRVAKA
jgi:hypothetical protein